MLSRRQLFGRCAGLVIAIAVGSESIGAGTPPRAAGYQMRVVWNYGTDDMCRYRYDMLFSNRRGGITQLGVDMCERQDDLARGWILGHAGRDPDLVHALPLDVVHEMPPYRWVPGYGEIV